jgi:tricorn protease
MRTVLESTTSFLLLAFLSALPALAGDVDLPRYPSISPDGTQVVFSWRGDLWLAPVGGGQARRLTVHPGVDSRSAWRPDGRLIAFESDRDGYRNIWTIQPDGSGLEQVVQTDRYAVLNDFGSGPDGPDAPTITFDSRVEGDFYRSGRPYEVDGAGGPFQRVHDAFGSAATRSPSGDRVLFERGASSWTRRHYRGPDARDVWLHSPDGGFQQLTTWEGNDGNPKWLDEDTMVFMSDREHDTVNLYRQAVVPGVEHAEPLTAFTDRDITAFDISGDGRTAIIQKWDTLHSLDLEDPDAVPVALSIQANEDGMDREVLTDVSRRVTEAALSPDGKVMAVVAYGDVWVRNVDASSPTRRITRTLAHDQGIAWSPDGLTLYFVTDEDGIDSIRAATVRRTRGEIRDAWTETLEPEPEEPVEEDEAAEGEAEDAPADDADTPNGPEGAWTITIDFPGGEPIVGTVEFTSTEEGGWSVAFESPTNSGTGTADFDAETGDLTITLQPENGPEVEVEARLDGDTLTGSVRTPDGAMPLSGTRVAAEEDEAEAEAEEEEADAEPDPAHDPDRWHDALEFDITPVIGSDRNERDPRPSPDGTMLAYRVEGGDIRLFDLVTGEDRLLHAGWDFWTGFTWSPDSRTIALTVDDRNFNSDIWLLTVDGSADPVNISRHPDNDVSPSFSADGRILVFSSERSDEEYDVYRVYLDKSLERMHEPELDAYFEEAGKAAKKRKPIEVRTGKDEDDDEDEAADEPDWEPSLDDAYRRLQRMSSLPGNERSVMITPAGDQIIYTNSGGGPGDSGIWSVKWNGTGAKRLGSGSPQHLTLSGDKIVTVSGGAGLLPVSGGSTKSIPIDAEIDIDLEEQSSRKFSEAVRIFGEVFYHPEMKGYDWDQLAADYHELAKRAWTGDEFNWVAARLLGELNASHTGIRASGYASKRSRSQGRLGTIHRPHPDGGFEVLEIVEGSPAADGPMPLQVGDRLLSIEGEPIGPLDTMERRLRGKVGEEVLIGIRREVPSEDPEIETTVLDLEAIVEPITGPAFERLRRAERERGAQAFVDAATGGRVGYLHIESMNQTSLDEFERDLYAVADGRDGLIIDVRNNGGGWTADRLLASIAVQPHAYTVPRGADPSDRTGYPQDRLFIQRYILPINMLCNEKSFSNAEITSHAFKTLERGTLVGQQTYGGVISTGGTSLVDGTSIRLPFRGWYLLDGTDMENNGAMPDIVVPQTPESESTGQDVQLEAALADLLKRLPDAPEGD